MSVIRPALDAIRAALHAAFPAHIIYVNDVPQNFVRPSFFVALASAPTSVVASDLRTVKMTWQVVYFPPLLNSAALDVDKFDLYDMHDRLLGLFSEPMFLRTLEGKVLDIEAFDGAPRDDAGYYTLRLDAQQTVRRIAGEPVREVAFDINLEE